jgi:hypothetical protein
MLHHRFLLSSRKPATLIFGGLMLAAPRARLPLRCPERTSCRDEKNDSNDNRVTDRKCSTAR